LSLDQLIPCGEMLLVKRDPPELRCGEILIPGTANLGVTTSGRVVRVGPRAEGVFAPGDHVIFGILAGLSLASEGVSSEEEYRLVAAGDVQCWIAESLPACRLCSGAGTALFVHDTEPSVLAQCPECRGKGVDVAAA
jgi:hypothetical protein